VASIPFHGDLVTLGIAGLDEQRQKVVAAKK